MSKISRVYQKIFGALGASSNFGEFGSLNPGPPVTTKDPTTIQALSAFDDGWQEATIGALRPAYQDMNSLFFLAYYQICYLLQMGVAEWDTSTVYYISSVVQYNGVWYQSLADINTGNTPGSASSVFWQAVGEIKGADITSANAINVGTDGTIFKITGTTTINTINNPHSVQTIKLIFGGVLTVTSSGNIILNNGNFLTAANSVLTLTWNGSSWVEVSRSPVPPIVGLGDPSVVTVGYISQAATDGYLVGYSQRASNNNGWRVYTDSNPTPTTVPTQGYGVWEGGAADVSVPINVPIKKGNYYYIKGLDINKNEDNTGIPVINFIPSGS